MKKISVTTTKDKEVVDITDEINTVLTKSKTKDGLCHLFLPHSTAGLTTALISSENELDLIGVFDIALPHITNQRHEHEHSHIMSRLPDHIISSFLGTSLAIPIKNGVLALGEFQRVVLVELNGPRKRTVMLYYD
ncbi:MAG: secondary thiamine-phosphate synthase enzyme YjbQ [Patescibacteria group bacterium]